MCVKGSYIEKDITVKQTKPICED